MVKQLLLSSIFAVLVILGTLSAWGGNRGLDDPFQTSLVKASVVDSLPPLEDRYEDFITNPNNNPFDLNDPGAVEQTIEYDPETGLYIVEERIGEMLFRPPTYISFDEYMEITRARDQKRYFDELGGFQRGSSLSLDDPLAGIDVQSSLLDRLFGGNEISIQPQGGIDLTFGFDYQYVENPILTERQKRNGGFDFDMAIQMNVTGQIGEKLKLSTNYNTQATFNFDNQIKLDYSSDAFGEDDILKKIEAGDVSLPLRGTLIQGAQSLFGLKTELQFGHLRLTAIASQQQSENENITIEGGAQVTEFEVKSDEYDENRHFFLSHYNRDSYEGALKNLPQISTLFNLENLEVWVTNDRNEVEDTRDIIALADLGEPERLTNTTTTRIAPLDSEYQEICDGKPLPDNRANSLYSSLVNNAQVRDIDQANAVLQSSAFQLAQARDFEKVRARKLNSREYTVHPELGFISLNIPLQPDQVLAVSYRYKYNGQIFRVGEMSLNVDDVSTDTMEQSSKVLFTKMLKSTTQRVDVPTWDLMMKNVYSIGAYQVNQEDFRLDVFYEDPGFGLKRFLPQSNLEGIPLIRVFNLDRLNVQNDPQPDGVFDFVPGVTINPSNGRIIFPVLEPFGSYLRGEITEPALQDTFVYQELYDQTIFQAQRFPEKNRYVIKGSYKSSVSSEISLGAFNIPQGSVTVTAGRLLVENVDYEIDYSTGRLRILNDAILASGVPINVSFEDNTVFGLQNKTMLGLRADYEVNENFNIGATFLNLFERPFTPKVNFGDDPINNRIYGLDLNYSKEAPFLTRLVDKLPFYSTTAPSSIAVMAEAAALDPGHARAINQSRSDKSGIVYVDDFEGSASTIDLRQPTNQWYLASIPQGQIGADLFPESTDIGLVTGANRARLNWYRIDPLARGNGDSSNPYTSIVPQNEVFPNRNIQPNQRADIQVFDLSFYPSERGPYNYDRPGGINGRTAGVQTSSTDTLNPVILNDPDTRWGGIMRALTTNDFQTSNIEYLEFWMLSPFLDESNPLQAAPDFERREGTLFFNFGNVSEDILKDSRRFFENGLPGPANPDRPTDATVWGEVPVGQQITRAFDNDPIARTLQDVGLDGLNDQDERTFYADYVNAISAQNPQAANNLLADVSNDNFRFYGDGFTGSDMLKRRYREFNNPQGNSGANQGTQLRQSGTNIPDSEDLDRDNTLNETESYFQYRIPIEADPANPRELMPNDFITDRREDDNGRIWYRYRIPFNAQNDEKVGGITDFRSIRFMRMFLKGFQDPVTLRFASLELVRNQWRRLDREGLNIAGVDCGNDTRFQVDAVNIEENSSRTPFAYTLPDGIQREQSLGVFNALQNEQSLSLRIDNLCDGGSESVFKYTELDMRLYERLQMFVHAEERGEVEIPDDALSMFIRLGSDFSNNYYEYEIPLKTSREEVLIAPPGEPAINTNSSTYKAEVWREENQFDFPLEILKNLKVARNDASFSVTDEFIQQYTNPDNPAEHTIKVKGNPNLGFVKVMTIGVRNRDGVVGGMDTYSVEVWANELRLTGLDERGGLAALGRVDMQLADLGSVTVAGNYSSIGFGALDQGVMERSRERITGYDFAADIQLGKFLPEKWGIQVPFYTQYSNITTSPEYDPYDLDIRLKDKLAATDDRIERDSIREQAQEITNISTYNFTNVRKERTGDNGGSPKPWDIENFSASYGHTRTESSDPLIESDVRDEYTGAIDYTYSRPTNYIQPLKGLKSKPLRLLKEFNFNPLPNSFSFSTIMDRQFAQTRYRFSGVEEEFNTYFNKRFNWNRNYNLNWDFTRSLKFNFNANMITAIDEPDEIEIRGDSDITDVDGFRRDSIWTNIRNLGRPKIYDHNVSLSYTLPIRYLPYMDWVQVRAQYQANYSWNAASQVVDSLGNVIQNSQNRQVNADLNFDKLYDMVPFLKKINRPARQSRAGGTNRSSRSRSSEDGKSEEREGSDSRRKDEVSPVARALVRPLLLLRKARFTYSEQLATVVPGFKPQTELLGLSSGFGAPGWGFVAGLQPNIRGLSDADRAAANAGNPVAGDWLYENQDWITSNVFLNQDVVQQYTQNYDGRITIEPFQDFRIELEGNKSYTENYTENFKIFDKESAAGFEHRLPSYGGQLTVSYNALNTLFRSSTQEIQDLFQTFESYRPVISQRLGTGLHEDPDQAQLGYTDGFGRNQQDVVLPAFVAAYTGQDPNAIDLNLFNTDWKPNWRLTYNGLSKLKAFKNIFSSFNLSHGYKSTFSISNFQTSADYLATRNDPFLNGLDTVSYNFFPRIEVPDVVIQENFAPLFAVDMQFQNGMSLNFDYKQARTLALSVTSKLLSETRTQEFVTGFGYVMRGVQIGFLTGKKKKRRGRDDDEAEEPDPNAGRGGRQGQGRSGGRLGEQDLDLQFNFSYRDDITVAQKLDQNVFEPTRGSLAISLSPSAEYQLNKNLSLRLFLDYRRTIPKTSAGFPRTDAAGGVVVRFQLN